VLVLGLGVRVRVQQVLLLVGGGGPLGVPAHIDEFLLLRSQLCPGLLQRLPPALHVLVQALDLGGGRGSVFVWSKGKKGHGVRCM
jgi:hypothetical protein